MFAKCAARGLAAAVILLCASGCDWFKTVTPANARGITYVLTPSICDLIF